MEDNKKIFKFFGKPGEDYQLWAARTQAALYAKDVGEVIENDVLSEGEVDTELQKKICSACAVIIQGLGDKPLRLCLADRSDPFKMWKRLRERYAVSNTATRVQLQSKLSKLLYAGQVMGDYVDLFEDIFNRLAGMDCPISEELQVAMFLSSFGDVNRSKFGHAISSLQNIQDSLPWETVTARLLQAYEDSLWHEQGHKGGSNKHWNGEDQALFATKNWKRRSSSGYRKGNRTEKRRCFECKEIGHIARNCPMRFMAKKKLRTVHDSGTTKDVSEDSSFASTATLLIAETRNKTTNKVVNTGTESGGDSTSAEIINGCIFNRKKSQCTNGCLMSMFHSDGPCHASGNAATVDGRILLDSGASDHMVPHAEWLTDIQRTVSRSIALGNGTRVVSNWSGTLQIRAALRRNGETLHHNVILHDVLLVPALKTSLISISKLCDDGYEMEFGSQQCVALMKGYIEFYGIKDQGIYRLDGIVYSSSAKQAHAAVANKPAVEVLHSRLGHANTDSVRKLASSGAVIGMDLQKAVRTKYFCRSCMRGKQTKSVLRTNYSRSMEKGAVIHTDVCGPMSVSSFSDCRYFVLFVDEFSGYINVVPIKHKSDVKREFQRYHAWIERKFGCTVKRIHSDNGGEFVALKEYLISKGIEQTMAPPYSPNMNGIAERANRTIVESARSMMEHAKLPRTFWAEAVVHAARIRNIFFSPRDHSKTSYELMHGTKPNISYLRVFGCLGWNHIPKDTRKKLDAKSELGIVIGCFENSQYKLWIPSRDCAVISRDISICEDVFPANNLSIWSNEDQLTSRNNSDMRHEKQSSTPSLVNRQLVHGSRQHDTDNLQHGTRVHGDVEIEEIRHDLTGEEQEMLTHYPESNDPPVEESDAVENLVVEDDDRRSDDAAKRYPTRQRVQTKFFTPGSAHIASVYTEPLTLADALRSEESKLWQEAIRSELQSLNDHKVWFPTTLPQGQKPLPTRFVFQQKYDSDGNVVRHKARLVVQGHLQGSVEFTYAPVVDFTTVRMCLALAVQKRYVIHQMDVRTAFLHGQIDQEIYVKPPKGLQCMNEPVMRLQKGLYGLKQSPRLWNQRWCEVMNCMNFRTLISDPCVFVRGNLWLLLYVDDILIIGPELPAIDQVKHELASYLDVKDMGQLRSFLGIRFTLTDNGAWLDQSGYVMHILKRFGMENSRPVCTPMAETQSVSRSEGNNNRIVSQMKFQEIIGCLLFLATRTRPDISIAVGILCRYSSTPLHEHWIQIKRILRYLRGTVQYGLWFDGQEGEMEAYCDSDWAGSRVDRKSTSGILLRLGNSTVAWRTLKQNCVALSTTEAEYISMGEATKELVWFRKLMEELGCKVVNPTVLHVDNQGALIWGSEGVRHAKHVAIRVNFVKQEVDNKSILLAYCPSNSMPADILTKPLSRVVFQIHRESIGVQNMGTARGGVGSSAVTIVEDDNQIGYVEFD